MKKHDKKKSSGGRLREILLSPGTTIVMFAAAAILLLISGIGGARAALTYFSETYTSEYGMYHIGVTLMENNEDVSYRNYSGDADGSWDEATGTLLGKMLAEGEQTKIGTAYPEELKVRNSSGENTRDYKQGINQFVRVSLYKYWTDANGRKAVDLDPGVINLHLNSDNVGGSDDGKPWIIDEKASTTERTVLYYRKLMLNDTDPSNDTPDPEISVPFTDTLTIDEMVAKKVTQSVKTSNSGRTITTTYDYDGYTYNIEATVDAVQQNNAKDAILSAWGREVEISGSGDDLTLSLAGN